MEDKNLPKVTIQIVTWNSYRYLPDCLRSIFDQTYRDFQLVVIDNNSQDNSVDFIKKNYPEVAVFRNNRNLGFSKANNQGIKLFSSPYVVLCNPDIILKPDWLDKIMAEAEAPENEHIGAFGGKLLKLEPGEWETEGPKETELIDSCGIKIFKNRRAIEIGAGQFSSAYTSRMEVFGHSGALVLFKKQALNDCLIKTKNNPNGEYFDEDFYVYKEDVDLAWRLQLMGWKALFIPEAEAFHARSLSGSETKGLIKTLKKRKTQSSFSRFYSYRNHILLMIKNDRLSQFLASFFMIFWLELKKLLFVIFFEWSSLKAWPQIIRLWPRMISKRRIILKRAKVNKEEMNKWLKD